MAAYQESRGREARAGILSVRLYGSGAGRHVSGLSGLGQGRSLRERLQHREVLGDRASEAPVHTRAAAEAGRKRNHPF